MNNEPPGTPEPPKSAAWHWHDKFCEAEARVEELETELCAIKGKRCSSRFHGGEIDGWDGTLEALQRGLPQGSKSSVTPSLTSITAN